MHYYKRNIGDYAKKCGRLSMLQHGAYTLLIDACYDRETFPTLRDAMDWTWASSKEEIEAVEFVLSRFFTLKDGVFVQERIAEEIAEYHNKAEQNKRIAIERETKRASNSTNRAPVVNAAPPVVNEAPPNHKPLTNNQVIHMSTAKLPTCPVEQIIDLYNKILPELPQVKVVNDKRQKDAKRFWTFVLTSKKSDGTLRAVSTEQALEWIEAYFVRARENDFVMGKTQKSGVHADWIGDFDYLLSDKGIARVIEKTREAA